MTGTGSYTGGTYSSSPAGLTINSNNGSIRPGTSIAGTYIVTYRIPVSGGCPALQITTTVTITAAPVASFNYNGTPYCSNEVNPSPVFSGGGVAGTFSSTAGLVFVSASTGQINLAASTSGTYTVTNTIAASGGCAAVSATSPITITALPAATISYTGTPFCRSVTTAQLVNLNGTGAYTGGTYSSSPAGLTINSSTGAITPNTSTAGTYTVAYTIPASGGCPAIPVTTLVIINSVPTATISYSSNPFCTSEGPASPTITGLTGGPFTGTNFSSSAGLTINPSTGIITPGSSTPGTYTVTYSFTGANGCINTSASAVTINPLPVVIAPASLCTGNTLVLSPVTGGTWTSSDNSIATVTNAGVVTGISSYIYLYAVIDGLQQQYLHGYCICPSCTNNFGSFFSLHKFNRKYLYNSGAGMSGYNWTISGGIINSGLGTNSVSVTWNSAGSRSISVNYTGINGCLSSVSCCL